MPTAAWREEKASFVVEELCTILTREHTPEDVKRHVEGALGNALKLFADALQERLNTSEVKWSPGVVRLFANRPAECSQWLRLMAEPEFSAAAYWK